jgi:hypothetical protein
MIGIDPAVASVAAVTFDELSMRSVLDDTPDFQHDECYYPNSRAP